MSALFQKFVAWIKGIPQWFADFKQKTQYYGDFVHAFVAYGVVMTLHYKLGGELWLSCLLMLLVAAALEVFDQLKEKNPPQTIWMDLRDFADYAAGVALAAFVIWL